MEYRSADMIELHEPGIRLLVHGQADIVGAGFTDDGINYFEKRIVLDGNTLADLAELFGIDLHNISRRRFNHKEQKEVTYTEKVRHQLYNLVDSC